MGIPVLLVATTTTWLGTARVPKVLARAGFDVSLLTPRHSLAEASRFIRRIGRLGEHTTRDQWFQAFAAMVDASAPRLVIPCDDMAFRLLAWIATERPPWARADTHARLATLIHTSLGRPAHYLTSVDKTLLPPLAQALGVRVPPYAIVADIAGAEAFAARYPYPVVLKRGHGFAGQGVAICADRSELARAFDEFMAADAQDAHESGAARLLLQAHVAGRVQHFHATAWQGEIVAGWALDKLIAHPEPTGPSTVTRYYPGPGLRRIAADLARGLCISGLFFAEFIVDPASGAPCLLEINRRVSPATHRGALYDVDLCAALFGALQGTASKSRAALDPAEEGITVHFPQEWLRDPESPHLSEYPSDVPWDEPALIETLLGLRG